MRVARVAFVSSALWAVGASAYLLLSPLTIHEVRAAGSPDSPYAVEEITRQASWYEVQGPWGVILLAIFALLFVLIALLASRKRYVASLALSVLAGALVVLAGFSIGLLYFPAAAFAFLGWVALGVHRLLGARAASSA